MAIAFGALSLAACSPTQKPDSTYINPIDPSHAEETRNLLLNLHRIGWDPGAIMFGQEFPLSYDIGMSGHENVETSDVKDVVGDHPGVHGSDFHFMIDKPEDEIARHKAAARKAYQDGAMVTFDYHWMGKYGDSHNWHPKDAEILHKVVNNDDSEGDVTWFYQHLDEVLEIVNEDLRFPIVFRPFHEMNGDWFWWGSKLKGGPKTYRRAYQTLVEYMSERSEYILFCWSPDKALAKEYYPGDEYVDIIGVDGYGQGNPRVDWFTVEQMVALLEEAVDFAAARGKVAAFTETGHDTTPQITYERTQPNWWMESVLEPILASDKASRIAWILTWVNGAGWSGPYVPHENSPQAAKDAFIEFYKHPVTLFQHEVAAEKLYQAPQSAAIPEKQPD